MDQITLGDVTVTRVKEYYGSVEMGPREFFPESPDGAWDEHRNWLAPDFLNPETGECVSAIQTWLLRSEGRTILVDTGVGNHKDRPYAPVWSRLDTNFLDNLAAAGVRPEDVDVVVNTHVHYDHVGWNTVLRNGEWVPAFPNATYLIPRADQTYFDPRNAHRRPAPRTEHDRLRREGSLLVYADSIAPVLGKAVLWEGNHRIGRNLTLEPAPGHTPGSSVVRLASGGERAVFVGDLLHSPVQILAPQHSSCFCEDEQQAAVTRRRVLERAADDRELVVPAHFAGPGAAEVRRDGSRFAIRRWAGDPVENL